MSDRGMPLSEREILVMKGICPECRQDAKANLDYPASFRPEWAQTMRDLDINLGTGHKNWCSYNLH